MNQQQLVRFPHDQPFQLGKWVIHPAQGTVTEPGNSATSIRIKPRAMDVLCFLGERADEVVAVDEILDAIWGQTNYAGPNAVRKCITELRSALDDPASDPTFIETIPKRGYRCLVAPTPVVDSALSSAEGAEGNAATKKHWIKNLAIASGLLVIAVGGFLAYQYYEPPYDLLACIEEDCEPPSTTLLVRSFEVVSADAELEDIADAMRQALLARLGEHAWIHRIDGRKGSTTNAEHVYENTLRRKGNGYLIASRIVRNEDSHILFERVFDTNAMYAPNPVEKMPAYLAGAAQMRLDPKHRELMKWNGVSDAVAWWLWNQNRSFPDSLPVVLDLIELNREVLSFDPDVSEGYVQLAQALSVLVRIDEQDQFFAVHEELVELLLQARYANVTEESRRIVALMLAEINGDLKDIERILSKRIEQGLEPESDDLERRSIGYYYFQYANLLQQAGLTAEAHAFRTAGYLICKSQGRCQSTQLPLPEPDLYLVQRGEWAELTQRWIEQLDRSPGSVMTLSTVISLLARKGELETAERYLARLLQVDASQRWYASAAAQLSVTRTEMGLESESVQQVLSRAELSSLSKALIQLRLGEIEAATMLLRKARVPEQQLFRDVRLWQEHLHFPGWVRDAPEYQALLASLGVGQDWQNFLQERVNALSPMTGVLSGGELSQEHKALLEEYSSGG